MARLVIDPVTRIGGQLRVEADVDGGKVTQAYVSATMFRGMEAVLRGRDPRDAWLLAQRICGTCTGVHAQASVRAVEQALGIVIPTNARLVRNILTGTLFVRDHVMTLYQRALPDWADISAAVAADPDATARLATAASGWKTNSAESFKVVRDRLAATIASGQPGPFAAAWAGHPAYRLSPEQSLLLWAHALEAIAWQRDFMRVHALLSGKEAHPQTYLVGGMALAAPWGGPAASKNRQHPQVPDHNAPSALSEEGVTLMRTLVAAAQAFIEQVVVPDTAMLVAAYPDWATIGAGPGSYLCNGEFALDEGKEPARLFPAGHLTDGNLERSEPVSEAQVGETVIHAWYSYDNGDESLRRPFEGDSRPAYDGQVPLAQLSDGAKYSWVKGARLDGRVMETGPLARVLVAAANGQSEVVAVLAKQLDAAGFDPTSLPSVAGRMLARSIEAEAVCRKVTAWLAELQNSLATGDVAIASVEMWDPVSWPSEVDGSSLGEGPRGAVGHWLRIKDAVIDRYQVVDGSTWNASPRDSLGAAGPLETALAGTPVADPKRPVELLRVIHSFAPCAACAAHVHGPAGAHRVSATAPEGTR
jgi:hydrogenase large subunit